MLLLLGVSLSCGGSVSAGEGAALADAENSINIMIKISKIKTRSVT